jgi:hypothetical protein
MFSRREFIRLTSLSPGLFLLNPLFCTKEETSPYTSLLFSKKDIPEIKRRLELPIFKDFWQELLDAKLNEDKEFLETGVQYNNQLRHIPKVNDILQREAFVYVITKDKTRGELARLAAQTILKFEKWDYFIEAGKYIIGLQRAPFTTQTMILTYEWIYDLLSEEEREEILKQIPEKGCEPCYRSLYGMLHKDEVIGWGFDPESSFFEERDFRNWPTILSRTNLRAVPMSALGLGAVFFKDSHPRAKEWLKVVKESYENFVDLFEPDGSYPEGTGYCRYTAEELILMLDVLKRKLNLDWSDKVNWKGVMDFLLITRLPTEAHPEGHVNFGDGGHGFGSDIGFWIANKFKDNSSQYAALEHHQRHKIVSPIWYNPKLEAKKPEKKWFYRSFDIGWVVASTGFLKDDFVVALRSGGPANHENADRNSIILKSFSENLLVDTWHPPYDHNHPAWTLRTSPAHNTVLIDGKGHQYHDGKEGTNSALASSKVKKEKVTENYAIVSSDGTHAYQLVNANVKNVMRTFLTIPELKFLLVIDSFSADKKAAEFTVRWFVDNEDKDGKISINKNQFLFQRPNAKLIGVCDGIDEIVISQSKFPVPEEHGIYPHLDITTARKQKNSSIICAMAALKKDEKEPVITIAKSGKTWKVETNIKGKKLEVVVETKELIPAIKVSMS